MRAGHCRAGPAWIHSVDCLVIYVIPACALVRWQAIVILAGHRSEGCGHTNRGDRPDCGGSLVPRSLLATQDSAHGERPAAAAGHFRRWLGRVREQRPGVGQGLRGEPSHFVVPSFWGFAQGPERVPEVTGQLRLGLGHKRCLRA